MWWRTYIKRGIEEQRRISLLNASSQVPQLFVKQEVICNGKFDSQNLLDEICYRHLDVTVCSAGTQLESKSVIEVLRSHDQGKERFRS